MDPYKVHFKKVKNRKTQTKRRKPSAKRGELKGRKKSFPVSTIVYSFFIFVSTFVLINNLDSAEKFFSKVSISVFSKSKAQDSENESQKSEEKTQDESRIEENKSTRLKSDEKTKKEKLVKKGINYFKALETREESVIQRELAAVKLEKNLQLQKEELDAKIGQLEQLRAEIGFALKDEVKTNGDKLNKLTEIYSNMKPKSAASVFEKMDDELAIKILNKMKKKKAAAILNLVEVERAKVLTEKIAGYVGSY